MHDNTIGPDESTDSTLRDAALTYAERGFRVHPLYQPLITGSTVRCSCPRGAACPPRAIGKHPRLSDWPAQATTDPAQIRHWWRQWPQANIGIVTGAGSGMAIVDVDPRNGGSESLEDLQRLYHPFPDTPLVLSGGGGQHYYFRLDADLPCPKLAPGIDFLADGGHYALAPPSLHASSRRYTWELSADLDDTPLSPLPAWLIALVHDKAQEYTKAAADLPDDLPEVDVDTFRVSARMKRVIIEGNDRQRPYPSRSEAVFAVIQAMLRAGHDDATIAAVLLDARYGISERQLEKKNPRSPNYWILTLGWVAREIGRARAKEAQGTGTGTAAAGRSRPDHLQGLQLTRGGVALETIPNVLHILRSHPDWQGRLWFDRVRNRPMLGEAPVADQDVMHLAAWLGERYDMPCRQRKMLEACLHAICAAHPRDLLREYLEQLPAWDGMRRLHDWLHTVAGARLDKNCETISRILPLSLVARALEPGSMCRYVVILRGEEDTGKSTLLHDLVGEEWYIETSGALEGKEPHLLIQGAWLCELSELDSLSRTEENRLKSFLTMRKDSYVPKYSNLRVDTPRRTVFAGTTNDDTILKGQTGNTRFFILKTGTIDLPALHVMREQLLAEALHVYRANPATWWVIDADAMKEVKQEREERRVTSVYEEALSGWLEGKSQTTWEDIARHFLLLETPERWKDKQLQAEVTKALKGLHWSRGPLQREGTVRKRSWLPPSQEDGV